MEETGTERTRDTSTFRGSRRTCASDSLTRPRLRDLAQDMTPHPLCRRALEPHLSHSIRDPRVGAAAAAARTAAPSRPRHGSRIPVARLAQPCLHARAQALSAVRGPGDRGSGVLRDGATARSRPSPRRAAGLREPTAPTAASQRGPHRRAGRPPRHRHRDIRPRTLWGNHTGSWHDRSAGGPSAGTGRKPRRQPTLTRSRPGWPVMYRRNR